jgi:hypothetical protein
MSAGRCRGAKCALASFTALSIGHNIGIAALEQRGHPLSLLFALGLERQRSRQGHRVLRHDGGAGAADPRRLSRWWRPGLAAEYTRLPRSVVLLAGFVCLGVSAAYLVASVFDWRPIRFRTYYHLRPAVPPGARPGGHRPAELRLRRRLPAPGHRRGAGRGLSGGGGELCHRQCRRHAQPCARRARGDRKCHIVPDGRRAGDRRRPGVPHRLFLRAAGVRRQRCSC